MRILKFFFLFLIDHIMATGSKATAIMLDREGASERGRGGNIHNYGYDNEMNS